MPAKCATSTVLKDIDVYNSSVHPNASHCSKWYLHEIANYSLIVTIATYTLERWVNFHSTDV